MNENVIRFYNEEIFPLRANSLIGYQRAFADMAIRYVERMDTIPMDSVTYVGYNATFTVNRSSRKVRLDAYYFDESSGTFYAYVIVLNSTDNIQTTFSTTEYTNAVDSFTRYVNLNTSIVTQGDKTELGVKIADEICRRSIQVREYKLTLITDMCLGNRLDVVKRTEDLKSLGDAAFSVRVCDLTSLMELSQARTTSIRINFDTEFPNTRINVLPAGASENCVSYLCAFPGLILAKLYKQYSAKLLEGNVRLFLGLRKKINRDMKDTILHEPGLVFAYNNGLSVTATKVVVEKRDGADCLCSIEGMKIVNGGQTTATLANVLLSGKSGEEILSKVFVQMKINQVNPDVERELVPQISQFANAQNAVKSAALQANSPFQMQIEKLVSSVHPETNKRWFYERLEGHYQQEANIKDAQWKKQHPKEFVITKEEFAKGMVILKSRPEIAAKGGQKCFLEAIKIYELGSLSPKEWDSIRTEYDSTFVQSVLALTTLIKSVVARCKANGWQCANVIGIYTATYVLHKAANLEGSCRTLPFEYICSKQALPAEFLKYLITVAEEIKKYLVEIPHVNAKEKIITIPTEWAKDPLCWKDIQRCDIPMPESVQQCLVEDTAWEKRRQDGQTILRDSIKREEEYKKLNALLELGVGGLRIALDLVDKYPVGVTDEEHQEFTSILCELNKKTITTLSNAKRDRLIDVMRKIYDFDNKFFPCMRGV